MARLSRLLAKRFGQVARFKVNSLFTNSHRNVLHPVPLNPWFTTKCKGCEMKEPAVSGRVAGELAAEMLALFGAEAASEASRRASKSRNIGNALGYCTWRQAERLIEQLTATKGQFTVH